MRFHLEFYMYLKCLSAKVIAYLQRKHKEQWSLTLKAIIVGFSLNWSNRGGGVVG